MIIQILEVHPDDAYSKGGVEGAVLVVDSGSIMKESRNGPGWWYLQGVKWLKFPQTTVENMDMLIEARTCFYAVKIKILFK